MNDRTVAFVLGGVTVLAWMIFWNGLIRSHAANHPESGWDDALLKHVG
jgi:hypothetical protein